MAPSICLPRIAAPLLLGSLLLPGNAWAQGEGIDLECELTIRRHQTSITVWPVVKDVPAHGTYSVKVRKVGGGGTAWDRNVGTVWKRGSRRTIDQIAGEYHDCVADAGWGTAPAPATVITAPMRIAPLQAIVKHPPPKRPR